MDVLFLNKDFLACVKPQGLPSQPDTSGDNDMTSLLKQYLKARGENEDIFVLHRLDRATGGVMIYARNQKSAAELSRLIAEKDGFEKHYLTVVSGVPSEKCGNMTDYLYKDSAQKKSFVVKSERKGAKLASLDYEVINSAEINTKTFSLVGVKLNTGRFHQIRAQFSSRGMSVFGDGKYGSREKAPHFALWANKIAFTYKGKKYEFEKAPDMDALPWNYFE
jgi:23S rRNA pseudouridine1911/1915/1917 synthase